MDHNTITNNTSDGVEATAGIVTTATITNNEIGGNQQTGMLLSAGGHFDR